MTTVALRQYLYLVFVEVPLKIRDFIDAVVSFAFRAAGVAVGWILTAAVLGGLCWVIISPLLDIFRVQPLVGVVIVWFFMVGAMHWNRN